MRSLRGAGFSCSSTLVPDGEGYKDYFWNYYILTDLLKTGSTAIVCYCLGGGVIGDMTGFAASVYMRGIHFIQAPQPCWRRSTVPRRQNRSEPSPREKYDRNILSAQAWYGPMPALSRTLPEKQLLCGIAEIIKYGVIWDAGLFGVTGKETGGHSRPRPENIISYLIKRSCEIKAEVVSKDEREGGLRTILNYGHTIGHAVETETGYSKISSWRGSCNRHVCCSTPFG